MVAEDVAFARLVLALDPYLRELVFIGGWAHRLFVLHEAVSPIPFTPLMTIDADIASPPHMKGATSIDDLLRGAGFLPEYLGDQRPPVTHYHFAAGPGSFYAEFLVNRSGGQREDRANDTVTVAGVVAQRLRYIDLLLARPWTVHLQEAKGFPVGATGLAIRICNPASFIAQKLLIFDDRKPGDQAKDLLYIHDTVLMVARSLPAIRELWVDVQAVLHPKQRRRVEQARCDLFGAVGDRIRGAADIARHTGRPSPPSPEQIRQVCSAALAEIFS